MSHPVRRRHRDPVRWLVLGFLVLVAVSMLLPLLIVAFNALKSGAEYATSSPLSPPRHVDFGNLTDFWTRVDYGRKLWNSLLSSGSVAVLAALLSLLNAYAIGIGRVRGRIPPISPTMPSTSS